MEAWFHHPGHPYGRDRRLWDELPSRIPEQVSIALDLLDRAGSRATCFFLGWAARRHPETVREAVRRGHEVACHGTDHLPVREMEPDAFRADLRDCKSLLEDLAGREVSGFRAPAWSIHGAPWAYQVLAECGFLYSSSRLRIPGLGRGEEFGGAAEGVLEIPALASPWMSAPFPAGGTVALRLLPLKMLEACRDETLASGRPAVYWFHPWEVEPASPELPGLSAPARFQRYGLLSRLPGRILHLAGGVRRTLGEAAAAWRRPIP